MGLIFHIIYYVFAILSLGDYEYAGHGMGQAFKFWIYSLLIALIVIVIYLPDGIMAFTENRKLFNTLKFTFIVVTVPLWIFVGCGTGVANLTIWNIYFTLVFVIQIVSLFVKNESKQQ